MVRLFEVSPIIWETVIEELEVKWQETDFQSKEFTPDWRKLAHRRKLEREIFQKYGHFKDIILHPKFQFVKHYYDENADFNLFVGDPILPVTTAIIVLFILYKKVNNSVLLLIASLLFNLNPFYVALLAMASLFFTRSRREPKKYRLSKVSRGSPAERRSKPVPLPYEQILDMKAEYDHIIIGNSFATLYAAALLAKNGHRVCVLRLSEADKSVIFPPGAPCPAPIEQITVNKLERYQFLLDSVQSLAPEMRTKFVSIASEDSAFIHSIVKLKYPAERQRERVFSLRFGQESLVSEIATAFPLNKAMLAAAFQSAKASMGLISHYLYSHILPSFTDSDQQAREQCEKEQAFQFSSEFVRSPVEKTLANEQLDWKIQQSINILSSIVGVNEYLSASNLSSISLGNLLNADFGTFVPEGGVESLLKSFYHTILQGNGEIYSDVDLKGLEIEEVPSSSGQILHRAVGINVANPKNSDMSLLISAKQSVISGLGVLNSYATLIPHELVATHTQQSLSGLRERRPKAKIVFWLAGAKEELGILPLNYEELEVSEANPHLQAIESRHPKKSELEIESKMAKSHYRVWSPSAQDPNWPEKEVQVVVVEMELGEPVIQLEEMRWPEDNSVDASGPKFYVNHRDDLTSPNHREYALRVGSRRLTLTASQKGDILRQAELLFHSLYPLTRGKVSFSHVEEPCLGGSVLANTTRKYESHLSVQTEVENLFLTGTDFGFSGFAGELQGGWLTANAVLGYTLTELNKGENLFADLQSLSLS